MELRPYQQRTIDSLYEWFRHNGGHPCLVLPTGSGKSHIIAELCRDVIQSWPDQKILVLTHVKELIEQDAEKILMAWPTAPLGIFSAGIGRKELGNPITVASIQSIGRHVAKIGHVDLIIVDEAHLISHKNEGGYRRIVQALEAVNPNVRVIGLTATPYRLGHGLITEGGALFDALIEPTSIEELIYHGHLAPLRSKLTDLQLSTAGVRKRGGEFIESELQAAINKPEQNERIIREIVALAGDRKAWLLFCTGVDHALAMRDLLRDVGVTAECVLGETPKPERERMLEDFKSGRVRAMTNANVLTTGFDYPDVDLIAMCRPTMSPGLYVQMAGRGMRVKSHTDHCLVLDFAGVVQTHGPITAVRPPSKKGTGQGVAPVKVCERCHELVHPAIRECPACGFVFPPPQPKKLALRDVDIMGRIEPEEMQVDAWEWKVYTSRAGKEMVTVTYCNGFFARVTEYLCLLHGGYAGAKAVQTLALIARGCGVTCPEPYDLQGVVDAMSACPAPSGIAYTQDGKYNRVIRRWWDGGETQPNGL